MSTKNKEQLFLILSSSSEGFFLAILALSGIRQKKIKFLVVSDFRNKIRLINKKNST